MIPSSTDLEYLLEVSHTSNISRAAERLGVSQPAVSLAIRRLEESYGTPLLIRNKSGVVLTHAGKKLIVHARNLLLEWERVRYDALRDGNELRGRYILGCHPSVALTNLPKFLPGLLSANPHLEIKLTHDLSRKIAEDVTTFKIDFGIVVNPQSHPDLVIRPISTDIVSLWTVEEPSTLQDLHSGSAVLIYDPDILQSQALLKKLKRPSMKFARELHTSNLEVITSLVACKAGIGILPANVATRSKVTPLKLLTGAPKFNDRICLVYRADAQRSQAGRALAAWIERHLKAPLPN